MRTALTFVTSNAGKAEQLGWHFGIEVQHEAIDVVEIQSLSLREVVVHKARAAFDMVGGPVLVEDTSLVFNALGRLPGPLIKWFLEELGNDGLCKLLDKYRDRSALGAVMFGYFDGQELKTFEGAIKGSIARKPRGENGFGWDPIFIPQGHQKTWGEMTKDEQMATSMRKIALEQMVRLHIVGA